MNGVKEKLAGIFSKVFNKPDIALEPYMTADDFPGYDSFHHFQVINFVEKEFNVEISNEEASRLKNVGNLIDLINMKLKG